jgi:uncharacterized protein YjdB
MKRLLLCVLLLGVSLFVSCGGSSSSSGGGGTTVTLQSIQVTPSTPSINSGATQQFQATGVYSDGSTKSITASVNWLSSSPAVATITTSGLATGVGGGTSNITATSGSVVGSTTLTVVALQSITVAPPTATVQYHGTQQFTATGNYSDGSTKNLTTSVTWSATAGASITTGGLATGTAAGSPTITATLGAISGTAVLTVNVPLVSIAVTPPTASVAPNGTQQFTAIGTYADTSTQDITSSVTWTSSPEATITSGGLATGVKANSTATIMASSGSISGTAMLTITNPLVSIAVMPSTASIAAGFTQQFAATGTYADNSTQVITSTVTWASSNPAVATISNTPGSVGVATGVTAGAASITATLGSVTSPPAALTVTSSTLVSIAVSPASTSIVLGNQQQYTAIGTFSDSSTLDITSQVTWASSDTTRVSITVSGLATGVATTTTPVNITATKGAVVSPAAVITSVDPPTLVSIAVTPSTATLAENTSRQYTATGKQSNGSTINITALATWTSSDPTVATVGLHTGLVTAQPKTGSITLTVSYSGVTQTQVLDITNPTLNSITVTPIAATIPAGLQQNFVATASFNDGTSQDITLDSMWVSSDVTVATSSYPGRIFAVAPGSATITATFGGVFGTAQFTVNSASLTSIAVSPTSTILALGSSTTFQAIGTYSDGSKFNLFPLATWTSSNTTFVTIGPNTGVATGQSPGTANVSASYQSVTSNNAIVLVSQFPLVSITIAPATASVPAALSVPFSATGHFSDSSTQSLTTNVTWASSAPSIATISNSPGRQGYATGVAPGQSAITAVFASQAGTTNLTVNGLTINSIAVTPNPATATHGSTLQFTAIATLSDLSTLDLTSQVTWTSSDATVANINSGGSATTANPGTAVITASFTQNGTTVTGTSNLTVQ